MKASAGAEWSDAEEFGGRSEVLESLSTAGLLFLKFESSLIRKGQEQGSRLMISVKTHGKLRPNPTFDWANCGLDLREVSWKLLFPLPFPGNYRGHRFSEFPLSPKYPFKAVATPTSHRLTPPVQRPP